MKMKRCMYVVLACILLVMLSVPATAMESRSVAYDEQCREGAQQDAIVADAAIYDEDRLIKANPSLIGETYAVREGTRSIEPGAFQGCSILKEVIFPDTVKHIGKDVFVGTAFYHNEANWQDGMLIIDGEYVVALKKDVAECYIPSGVSVIADGIFEDCDSLRYLVVSPTVETLGAEVFAGLTHDTEVYYTGSLDRFMENTDMQIDELNMTTIETRALLRILFALASAVSLIIIVFVIRNWYKKKTTAIENEEEYEW